MYMYYKYINVMIFCRLFPRGYEVCGMDHLAHGLSEGFRAAYGRLELEALQSCWSQFILEEVISMEGPVTRENMRSQPGPEQCCHLKSFRCGPTFPGHT